MSAAATSRCALLVACAAALLAGCMSIEEMAPPVEGPLGASPATNGFTAAQLTRGRDIYLGTCVKCHTVQPIGRYSLREWRDIVPDMSRESRLNPEQIEDLRAYVMTARAFLEQQPRK